MKRLDSDALVDLAETLGVVVEQFIEQHPETPISAVAAALSYVHGSMFRLASEIPPSKLH